MKPVEIEFIMRDKLSPGIDKAGKSAETLGDKAEQVSKSITDRIAAQKEQIKYVESCLKDLKKQYDNLAPGKAQLEMRAEIDACTKAACPVCSRPPPVSWGFLPRKTRI